MGISSNLPVCKGTASQGSLADCTVKCTISDMQPFTIHFRRPENDPALTATSKSTLYDGSYGFDWLRDEYVYDIEDVFELVDMSSGIAQPKKNRLYIGKVDKLINEYIQLNSKDKKVKAEINTITTKLGKTYIPAWLSVFPITHASGINSNGVDLYLEVEQEDSLSASIPDLKNLDGINIYFEADQGIDVNVKGIKTLADLLKGTSKEMTLNLDGSSSYITSKKIKRYSDKSKAINIKASSGIDDVRFVRIKATDTSKNCTKTVGLICIYPNGDQSIYHSDINFVPTLFAPLSKSYQLPTHTLNGQPFSVNKFLENNFLNQALVTTKIKQDSDFNIFKNKNFIKHLIDKYDYQENYSLSHTSPSGKSTNIINKHYIPYYKEDNTGDYLLTPDGYPILNELVDMRDDIINLYEKQKNIILNDDDDNNQTYVLLTDLYIADSALDNQGEVDTTTVAGVTFGDIKKCNSCGSTKEFYEWGNITLLFDNGKENYDVKSTAHELGHSFSLSHTFAYGEDVKHSFYQGYTDNIMDYGHKYIDPKLQSTSKNKTSISDSSIHKGKRFSLFKWQWEELRNDRSIKKQEIQ